jgi:hypothetical protein
MRAEMKAGLVATAFAFFAASGCGDDSAGPPPPPLVDVTGTWDVEFEAGGSLYFGTAVLAMDVDGNVTGTETDIHGDGTVTGRVSGYNISLTVDYGGGYRGFVTATIDPSGSPATGTWVDSDGFSGTWGATKP